MNKWSNRIKNTLSSDSFSASCLRQLPENQARERYAQAEEKTATQKIDNEMEY